MKLASNSEDLRGCAEAVLVLPKIGTSPKDFTMLLHGESNTYRLSSFFTLVDLIGVSFTLQVHKFIRLFAFDDLSLLIHLLKAFVTLFGVLTFDSNI